MPDKKSIGYAVVDVAGKQFWVTAGQELKVPHTAGEAGSNLQLERVLMLKNGDTILFGKPTIAGATVDATILRHGRDRKITVFKLRRRKGYRKKAGHRQEYSLLRINGINPAKAKPTARAEAGKQAPTTQAPVESVSKAAPKKPATAKKTTAVKKTAAAKKTSTAKKKTRGD